MTARKRAAANWAALRGQLPLPGIPPEYMRAAVDVGQLLVNTGYCDVGEMARALALVRDGAFEEANDAIAFSVARYRRAPANKNNGGPHVQKTLRQDRRGDR